MRTSLLSLALPLAAAASPVFAQATVVQVTQQYRPAPVYRTAPPPPPQPYIPYQPVPLDVNVFGGARIEATVGWEHYGRVDEDGLDGVSYGGEAGFDVPLGASAIIGGYGGVEGSSTKECDVFTGNVSICDRFGRTFTAGGRIGVLVSPRALLYAKGGYSNGRFIETATRTTTPIINQRYERDLDGFHVGGGIEAAFGRHAYGKLEYVYTQYNGFTYIDPDTGDTEREKIQRHQVKAGVGVRL